MEAEVKGQGFKVTVRWQPGLQEILSQAQTQTKQIQPAEMIIKVDSLLLTHSGCVLIATH